MERIRKAVFPVAGFGTRFLPVTKAMPKELLPIVDKPLIQYAAEEAISAGIDTLIFVTGRNKRAIEDHFDSNQELESILIKQGKIEQAKMVRNIIPKGVDCIFVRQAQQLGLGHAVLCSEKIVGEEPFALLLADDFIATDGPNNTKNLITAFNRTRKNQLSIMRVRDHSISKYGVVVRGKKPNSVDGLVEKPAASEAPSDLASIGRYVLSSDIFSILKCLNPGNGGEIQLADAIDKQAKSGLVESVVLEGQRFDCGSVEGYLDAIKFVSEKRHFSAGVSYEK